jgi:hypothetical protein
MIHADLMVVNARVRTLDDRNTVCGSFELSGLRVLGTWPGGRRVYTGS